MHALRMVSMNEIVPASPEISIVPTVAAHIRELRETIRDGDRREIEAYGFSCAAGLWRSYKMGLMNRTGLIDGKVAGVWGCGGVYMADVGSPWLMTSHEVKKISPLKFARIYQKEIYRMLEMFPRLVNYVHADYEESVRLLGIVGFKIGEPERIRDGMFRKFEMER